MYRLTKTQGSWVGLQAFKKRLRQCRGGYVIYTRSDGNGFEMRLCDGTIIAHHDIARHLLTPYHETASRLESSLAKADNEESSLVE